MFVDRGYVSLFESGSLVFFRLARKACFWDRSKKTQTDCFDCSWHIRLYSVYCCIDRTRTNCCIQPAKNFRVFWRKILEKHFQIVYWKGFRKLYALKKYRWTAPLYNWGWLDFFRNKTFASTIAKLFRSCDRTIR